LNLQSSLPALLSWMSHQGVEGDVVVQTREGCEVNISIATAKHYKQVEAGLTYPTDPFIGGEFRHPKSGNTMPTMNPATDAVITEVASCDQEDVDAAVVEARQSYSSGIWSDIAPAERKRVLRRFADLLTQNAEQLAVLESIESGKTIRDCVEIDVPETVRCIAWHAEACDKIYDLVSPSQTDVLSMIIREPIGVVGCVLPWNFPLMMFAWKVGPSLATGNSVIVKPAEETSMTALRAAELAIEAGLPPGVLNVLPGVGERAGRAIGLHPGIDMVAFTGSTEVGRKFLEYSAKSNLKRVVLECGGKNPCIVLEDVMDLTAVARHLTFACFWSMGQNCSSNSRLIVHRRHKDELLSRVVEDLQSWRVGDPLNPENRLGPLVGCAHYKKVVSHVDAGVAEGAELVVDGRKKPAGPGYFLSPCIFDRVLPSMTIAQEEIFGPVLSILTVDDDEQAICVANETPYGLQASLFTSDISRAHRLARAVHAGTVSVNCYSEGDLSTPFGGYKLSGFGGRDKSLLAHQQYTEVKTVWIDLGPAS